MLLSRHLGSDPRTLLGNTGTCVAASWPILMPAMLFFLLARPAPVSSFVKQQPFTGSSCPSFMLARYCTVLHHHNTTYSCSLSSPRTPHALYRWAMALGMVQSTASSLLTTTTINYDMLALQFLHLGLAWGSQICAVGTSNIHGAVVSFFALGQHMLVTDACSPVSFCAAFALALQAAVVPWRTHRTLPCLSRSSL